MTRNHIIGVYEDEDILVKAIHHVQSKNIEIKDVLTPIPVHGVFEALKLTTRLPIATFLYAASGTLITFAFLYWTSVVNYPLKFGGKPLNTLSFIIILFVGTIFIGTFFTFMTFFIRQNLFPGKKVQVLDPRSTDDKMLIVIDKDENLSDTEIRAIKTALKESGASEVNEVEEEIITKKKFAWKHEKEIH
jgi:hypothetical protein